MRKEDAMKLAQDGLSELNEALRQGRSETLVRYLEMLSRFHAYSLHNVILIASQRPDATKVAGFRTWKKFKRFVKKGEHGIAILAPMVSRCKDNEHQPASDAGGTARVLHGFRVVHVFDVSQTDGEDMPKFAEIGGEPGEQLAKLEHFVASVGIALRYEEIPSGALGVSRKGEIAVRPDLTPAQTFVTLAHEVAHELLHPTSKQRGELSKSVRETEAEAVAFIVSRAAGIESTGHSADYIQLYDGDDAVLAESLEMVQKTAAQIIRGISDDSESDEEVRHVA